MCRHSLLSSVIYMSGLAVYDFSIFLLLPSEPWLLSYLLPLLGTSLYGIFSTLLPLSSLAIRVCVRGSDNARSGTLLAFCKLWFLSYCWSISDPDRHYVHIFFKSWRHPILTAVYIAPHPTLLLSYSFCPSLLWRPFSLSLLSGMARCSPLLSSPSPPSR